MKEETSKKITLLNFILIALIVLLHSNNSETLDYSSIMNGGRENFVIDLVYTSFTKICETAVPTFLLCQDIYFIGI